VRYPSWSNSRFTLKASHRSPRRSHRSARHAPPAIAARRSDVGCALDQIETVTVGVCNCARHEDACCRSPRDAGATDGAHVTIESDDDHLPVVRRYQTLACAGRCSHAGVVSAGTPRSSGAQLRISGAGAPVLAGEGKS
jgi:hypothetical protein